jgi:hypothetical protein
MSESIGSAEWSESLTVPSWSIHRRNDGKNCIVEAVKIGGVLRHVVYALK